MIKINRTIIGITAMLWTGSIWSPDFKVSMMDGTRIEVYIPSEGSIRVQDLIYKLCAELGENLATDVDIMQIVEGEQVLDPDNYIFIDQTLAENLPYLWQGQSYADYVRGRQEIIYRAIFVSSLAKRNLVNNILGIIAQDIHEALRPHRYTITQLKSAITHSTREFNRLNKKKFCVIDYSSCSATSQACRKDELRNNIAFWREELRQASQRCEQINELSHIWSPSLPKATFLCNYNPCYDVELVIESAKGMINLYKQEYLRPPLLRISYESQNLGRLYTRTVIVWIGDPNYHILINQMNDWYQCQKNQQLECLVPGLRGLHITPYR